MSKNGNPQFQKGHKKVGGRQKGTKNKSTEVAEAFVNYIINMGERDAQKIWDGLKPKEQMDALIKLTNFVLPQKARVENENKLPASVTVNLIAATPKNELPEQTTYDITHEEINEEND